MANTILTNDMIFKLSLLNLENSCTMSRAANRNYEKRFVQGVGSTVRVGLPVQVRGRTENLIVTTADIVEKEVDLSIDKVAGTDCNFTQVQLSRDVTEFSKNYVRPQMIKIAQLIDEGVITAARLGFNQVVGTASASLNTYAAVDECRLRMEDMAIPPDETWHLQLNNRTAGALRSGIVGSGNYFTPVSNEQILMKGSFGMIDDFQLAADQNLRYWTTGTMAGTPLVAGAGQSGSTINLDGFTASAVGVLKAGDVIYFANVYAVSPMSYESLGYLQGFTVQADVTASAGGLATVTIDPPLIPPTVDPNLDIYQNVTASPADNAVVTCAGVTVNGTAGSYREGYFFTSCGLTLAAPPQVKNPGAIFSQNQETKSGITVGMNVAYNINPNSNTYRWDTYYGAKAFYGYGGRAISLN